MSEENLLNDPGEVRKVLSILANKAERARKDPSEFFTFVMREETTRKRLALAAHQKVLFDFVNMHEKCVLMIPVGHSKCTTFNTEIADPITGVVRTIQEIVENEQYTHVNTWSKENGVHSAPITAKHDTGTKECLRIFLRTGRLIDVTPEHPMLTPEGWKRADELIVGHTLAGANRIPHPSCPERLPDGIPEFLAVMLSQGCTRHAAVFTTADPVIVEMMRETASLIGCSLSTFKAKYGYGFAGLEHGSNPALNIIREYGLIGKYSKTKVIPDCVYRLPADQLAKFLSVFWMCDGQVSMSNGPSITLASETMIRQLQHLLLRFGIQTSVKYRVAKFEGKEFDAWHLEVRSSSLNAFVSNLSLWGEKRRRAEFFAARKQNANLGFPKVSGKFVEEALQDLKDSGVKKQVILDTLGWNCHLSSKELLFSKPSQVDLYSVLRTPFKAFYEVCKLEDKYQWLFDETIYWDEIVKIENIGERRVFDLTVEPTRCFLANDLIAHNTFCVASLAMWLLGNDPTTRGAIVSATQLQAQKPLAMVRDYIEQSPELRMVFPKLRRSPQMGHSWTQTSITVERPMGIKDHSLVAIGLDGAIAGSRLNFVLVDDILNRENTATSEQRAKVYEWFDSSVLSRLDPKGSRIIVTNTAWHSRDLVHDLWKVHKWPTLRMSTTGEVWVYNSDYGCEGHPGEHDLRDAWTVAGTNTINTDEFHSRLSAHDPDPNNSVPLFPERFPLEVIEEIKTRHLPIEFARAYANEVRNEKDSMCKKEWVDACKMKGRGMTLASEYRGTDATFTGVDLAISQNETADFTAFFTFRVLATTGQRLILDVDYGRYDGPTIVRKLIEKTRAFNSIVRVENNGSQEFLRQFANQESTIPIRAHTTGRSKAHPEHGVPGLFLELYQGAWIIPCAQDGTCHPAVQRWIDECLEYTPAKHTGDVLMSSYFAREQAKEFGLAWGNSAKSDLKNIGANIMSR